MFNNSNPFQFSDDIPNAPSMPSAVVGTRYALNNIQGPTGVTPA